MAAMQAQLTACCTAVPVDDTKLLLPGSNGNGTLEEQGRREVQDQLRIQPNPFSTSTTLTYLLDAPGQVRLIVSTSSGKELRVLEEGQRDAGTFAFEWNTTDLASGMYHVMLLVDGAPVVQKAVKIER